MLKLMRFGFMFVLTAVVAMGCWQTKNEGTSDSSRRAGFFGRLGVSRDERSPDFVTLAKKLQPVVVNVSATQIVRSRRESGTGPRQGDSRDEFLEKFFGVPPPPASSRQRSLGSGLVIKSDGTILTNAHVIANAEKILVKLSDKNEFEAKVVGKDLKTDIAIIKIDAKENLPTAPLGDSDRLEVGEWVMAVGNPFGLDNSVTSGIVSAKGRHIGAGPYDSFIQTDAPINPGSSGGPLVNLRGQVVGINMAIVSQTGGNIGIGFATPINLVKDLLPQLETKGKVTRGWAGMAVQELTPELAQTFGLEKPRGALVAGVVHGGPAERGGVKVGDIITEYDGQVVKEAGDFPIMVARTPVDKKVQLKVLRERDELRLALTIGELKETQRLAQDGELG